MNEKTLSQKCKHRFHYFIHRSRALFRHYLQIQHNELRLLWEDVSHWAKLNAWHYSRNTTSLRSPSYRLLESVLRKWWDRSWKLKSLPIPFTRHDTPSLLLWGGNIWGLRVSGELHKQYALSRRRITDNIRKTTVTVLKWASMCTDIKVILNNTVTYVPANCVKRNYVTGGDNTLSYNIFQLKQVLSTE